MNISSYKYHIFFKKLSTPLRVEILTSLIERPKTVTQLCDALSVEQSKISHALKSLYDCHIVNFKKEGKKRVYYLNKETILPIFQLMEKHEKKFCRLCKGWSK